MASKVSLHCSLCQFVLIFIFRDTDFVVLAIGRIFDKFNCLKLLNTAHFKRVLLGLQEFWKLSNLKL